MNGSPRDICGGRNGRQLYPLRCTSPPEKMTGRSETNVQPVCISIKGRKPYPTMNTAFYSVTKWGLPKLECSQELWAQALNIQYGNGAAVVVRAC